MSKLYKDTNKNFTMIGNKFLQSPEYDNGEKGLLCTLKSFPDDWDFTIEGIAKKFTRSGKDAVRSDMEMLIKHRLVFKTQLKKANGRFDHNIYIMDDEPMSDRDINRILALHGLMLDQNGIDVVPLADNTETVQPLAETPAQTNNIRTKKIKQIRSCPVSKSESNCNLTEETEDLSEIDFDMTDEEESYDALAGIEEEEAAKEEPDLFDVEKFKEQISYDKLVKDKSDSYTKQVKALLGVVSNALNHKEKLRISGRDMPLKVVADKFSLLRYEHILDVLETINKRLSKNKKPRDPKAYLLTMLFNSVDEYESKHISAFDKPVPETGNNFDLDEIEIIENSFAVSEDSCPSFTLEDLMGLANNFGDID